MAKADTPQPHASEFESSSEWNYAISVWHQDAGRIELAQLYMTRARYQQEREYAEAIQNRYPSLRQDLKPGSVANSVGMNRDPYVTPPYEFCQSFREIDNKGCDLPRWHMQAEHHFSRSLSDEELREARAYEASCRRDAMTIAKIFYGRARHKSPFKGDMPRFIELDDSSKEELISHGLEAVRMIRNRQKDSQ